MDVLSKASDLFSHEQVARIVNACNIVSCHSVIYVPWVGHCSKHFSIFGLIFTTLRGEL